MRIVPRAATFVELFAEMAGNLHQGAALLLQVLRQFENVEAGVQQLKEIEHRGDEVTHTLLSALNKTFITPFDREDIHRLASSLDDVLDFIYAAGERLVMYNFRQPSAAAVELAELIVLQAQEIERALPLLRKHDQVLKSCLEIGRLEKAADRVARGAIATLFEKEKDPISLIKAKELYEVMEAATDKAADVANVLESIVLKSG